MRISMGASAGWLIGMQAEGVCRLTWIDGGWGAGSFPMQHGVVRARALNASPCMHEIGGQNALVLHVEAGERPRAAKTHPILIHTRLIHTPALSRVSSPPRSCLRPKRPSLCLSPVMDLRLLPTV